MKHFLGGTVLLLLILALCLSVWASAEAFERKQCGLLEAAGEAALSGDTRRARALCALASQNWDRRRSLFALVSDHSQLEQLDILYRQLSLCRRDGEAALLLTQITGMTRALVGEQRLSWENLF